MQVLTRPCELINPEVTWRSGAVGTLFTSQPAAASVRAMDLVDRLQLPPGYEARHYRGEADHEAMAAILTAYHEYRGEAEMVTAGQITSNYAHLEDCDPQRDIYLIEYDGQPIAYGRTMVQRVTDGLDGFLFTPTMPDHLNREFFGCLADAIEDHLFARLSENPGSRYQSDASHPGPGKSATGQAAWLETRGYDAREWGAVLIRPHLEDIAERSLPDGVELRPATPDQLRTIVAAHHECFRGEWSFTEMTEADYAWIIDDPHCDHTLWRVAWAGDEVVGQVKSFINHDENQARGYQRGYTEYISTHRDWRNRGIAGTLLAYSLQALKDRGMTQAALGVDTNNPGGAFSLYQSMGFELDTYSAVYFRDVPTSTPTPTPTSTPTPPS